MTVVKEMATGTQLFAISRCVAVGNADEVDVAHGLGATQIEEVKASSGFIVTLFLVQ